MDNFIYMIGEQMKINPVTKSFNTLHDKKHPRPYDIIMTYCTYCKKRIDIKVYHPSATLDHYQMVNLPERIAKHLDERKIHCPECDKDFVLSKEVKTEKTDFYLKLDCSNMNLGMEYWYEDAIPKYSREEYAIC